MHESKRIWKICRTAYFHRYDSGYGRSVSLWMRHRGKYADGGHQGGWFREYGFTPDMVLEACERCALATDKHRFEYTDGILQSWKENGVHTIQDIQDADAAFQKKKTSRGVRSASSSNPFHQFRQNQYDYDELLQKVKIN